MLGADVCPEVAENMLGPSRVNFSIGAMSLEGYTTLNVCIDRSVLELLQLGFCYTKYKVSASGNYIEHIEKRKKYVVQKL